MKYIFVINGKPDKLKVIRPELERQLAGVTEDYDFYVTLGPGDAVRFVRLYCDFHEKEETCFVACGGSGTLNEVVSGLVGQSGKTAAFLAFGSTNDFCKSFPDLNFKSVGAMLGGQTRKVDVIRAGDNYSINVINCGFDAMVAYEGSNFMAEGMDGVKAYKKGILHCIFGHRYNRIKVFVDDKPLNRRRMLLCTFANASWCGGQFKCAPEAVVDDGLMDICLIKPMTLLEFILILKKYTRGEHLTDPFCMKRMVHLKTAHASLRSRELIYLCLDGEMIAASKFNLDVLPGAIEFLMPKPL